jgi:hypothetical protein
VQELHRILDRDHVAAGPRDAVVEHGGDGGPAGTTA